MTYKVLDLGLVDYTAANDIQIEILKKVKTGGCENVLILAEFLPVYTMGRKGAMDNLLVSLDFLTKNGIKFYNTNRGGDITAHNPGQLIVYPVFNLAFLRKDLNWYLRSMEAIVIELLLGYSIRGVRKPGLTPRQQAPLVKAGMNEAGSGFASAVKPDSFTGVWVSDEKISSIGIAVSRWTTYHGLALNVNNDLSLFDFINPCGIKNCGVTSIAKLKGRPVDMYELKERLIEAVERSFGIEFNEKIPAASGSAFGGATAAMA